MQLISSNPAAYIKVPKNAPKNIIKRYIISPEQFAALLENILLERRIERRSKGLSAPVGEKVSLVCTRDDGRLILRERIVNPLSDENLNAHPFRHTHATQLIESGASAKGVEGRLGHSNTQITQNLQTND